jgi:hypothetical protein
MSAVYTWCTARTYIAHASRLVDPGQRFLCAPDEATALVARGKASRDTHTPGVRVTTRCMHAALVNGLVVNGRRLLLGDRFECTDDEGAELAATGQAVRVPWQPLPALYEPLAPTLPQRARSVFRRSA